MATVSEDIDLNQVSGRARAYTSLFALPLKDRNWKGNPGDYAGSGVGSSLDFQDHRQYLPGDDPRHINWQAFARTGDYTLKLYREEVRPIVEIILDVSGSMFSGERKSRRVLEVFYFTFFAAEQASASAKVYLVKGGRWKHAEAHSVVTHRWTDEASALPDIDASAAPNLAVIPFRTRSLRIFISDGLFPASPESMIRALQHNNGRAAILCPFSRDESDPGWNGNYEFIDTESGAKHDRRIDPPLLKRYLQTYHNHFERWKAAAVRAQSPLARIPSDGSFEEAMKLEAIPAGAIQLA